MINLPLDLVKTYDNVLYLDVFDAEEGLVAYLQLYLAPNNRYYHLDTVPHWGKIKDEDALLIAEWRIDTCENEDVYYFYEDDPRGQRIYCYLEQYCAIFTAITWIAYAAADDETDPPGDNTHPVLKLKYKNIIQSLRIVLAEIGESLEHELGSSEGRYYLSYSPDIDFNALSLLYRL